MGNPQPLWTPPPSPSRRRRLNGWQYLNGWQKAWVVVGLLLAPLIGGWLVAGCDEGSVGDTGGTEGTSASPSVSDSGAPAEDRDVEDPRDKSDTTADSTARAEATAELPALVGLDLQTAQDTAQDAGFSVLTSHDASGRDRMQLWDRDWQVCFQTPDSGQHPTDAEVDFGVVALDETCPPRDKGADGPPETNEGTMPDLVGESANVAREALPDNAHLTVRDASGQERLVLVESNWRVCDQIPAAGDPLKGEPVTLDVMKFDETCP